MPKTRTVKQITEQRMVVTIDRDQNIYLNDQPINIHELPEKLHQAGADPAHQAIYLRSDERVPFGAFASVMDAVKQAGITNVSIVTQPLETKICTERRELSSMDGIVGGEHLEREISPEPVAGPATGAVLLHAALFLLLGYYAWILGLFHHNMWGNAGAGGAMQVNLVSNALPLPAQQINKNVLTTETPSQAPAEPSPKEEHQMDETAIPILGKHAKPEKEDTSRRRSRTSLRSRKTRPRTASRRARSCRAPSIRRLASNGPTTVGDNDFASRFGWYVDQINRKMANSWYKAGGGSAHAARGARVPGLHDQPRRHPQQRSTGPIQRQPYAGSFLRARRAAR